MEDLTEDALVRAFPKAWHGKLTPEQVGECCGDCEAEAEATYVVMGSGSTPSTVNQLIVQSTATAVRPESWRAKEETWLMSLHRAADATGSPPIGAIVFQPVLEVNRRTKRIQRFWLTVDLMWLMPSVRGQGYGKHLVAHLINYLTAQDPAASGHQVARGGVDITVHAEIHHPAAHRLMEILYDFFELQRETMAGGRAGRSSAWRVRSVEFQDDY